jgi:hypothetical protein
MQELDLITPSAAPQKGLGFWRPFNFVVADKWVPEDLAAKIKSFSPRSELGKIIKVILDDTILKGGRLTIEQANILLERVTQTVIMESKLMISVIRAPYSPLLRGNSFVEDYGIVSRRVVTDTGAEYVCDAFQNADTTSIAAFYWHALGTGNAAESTANTSLDSELTTDDTTGYRSAGTQTTGSAGAHVYETVGTVEVSTTLTIEEHGIFCTSSAGSTGLWDRSLTGSQALTSGDSLQATYTLTITAGG